MVDLEKESEAQNRLEEWIRKIGEGDQDALALFYEQTRTAVYALLLTYLDWHDAEDALHDTYLGIFRSAPRYRAEGKPMAWTAGIARNVALMKLREKRRETTLEETRWELFASAEGISAEDRQVLSQLLTGLKREDAAVVVLHAVSGLKFKEIGRVMEMPLSTVLSRYHRAMKKMRQAWKEASL